MLPSPARPSAGATSIGFYTRFGDVRELLEKVDDRYVIANAGDELALRFSEPSPPREGWVRDFVLIGDGWNKDGDYNTAQSKTVLPLPSHRRPGYDGPLTALEDDPVFRFHPDDWREYHTRYVTSSEFQRGLRPVLDRRTASADRSNPMKRFARAGVIVLFAGLLVTLRVLNHRSTTGATGARAVSGPAATSKAQSSIARYGLNLEEVSRSAGVDFVHAAPKLDAKLDHIMPQIASMGASVAVADFDRDGWHDFYATSSGEDTLNRLYRNQGDGTFRDVAAVARDRRRKPRRQRSLDGRSLGRLRQ